MSEETNKSGLDGLVDKAKEFLTDERIDQVADKAQEIAPDSVDPHIERFADKAKEYNDPDQP
jgi:hypothetical protein